MSRTLIIFGLVLLVAGAAWPLISRLGLGHSASLSGCPLHPRKQTSESRTAISAMGRLCSLIPGLGVKLSANILAGPLFSPR
jgi:hypothetical protein